MNRNILIFCFIITIITTGFGQSPVISSVKLGELKLEMSLDSVNKYLDKKVALKKFTVTESILYDTVNAIYKNIPIQLGFTQEYDDENKKTFTRLCDIYCDDKTIKTKSGIKLGDNKYDIIKKLESSYLSLSPNKKKEKPIQQFLW